MVGTQVSDTLCDRLSRCPPLSGRCQSCASSPALPGPKGVHSPRRSHCHDAMATLTVRFVFETLTDIAFLPSLGVVANRGRHFEFFIGLFQVQLLSSQPHPIPTLSLVFVFVLLLLLQDIARLSATAPRTGISRA